ncbi:efflux RND transporter periplasmic adaptor subunit [Paenibacillus sp. FJAT-26967]|uniref:efflux RND transporter periplasmic adaptor subunit n=1 Tax=Paenibacillus sp. FJAT-26967 TaxID=1729690 RepID=UPI000838185A|nr:efflux RND transporter periplasmic adaptor subunit [Paenibacillus sp. FJAT-26967]
MKKKIWALIAAVVVIGISVFLYIQSNPKGGPSPGDLTGDMGNLSFKAVSEELVGSIEVKGKSSYEKETWVHAPFSGDIVKWNVSEGTQVKKGDSLFVLDSSSIDNEIAQMQANLKKQDLEAQLAKFQENAGSAPAGSDPAGMTEGEAKKRYADAESAKIQAQLNTMNRETAQNQLNEKQKMLAKANFRAPEAGIFLFEDSAKVPQALQANDRIGKIVDLSKLELLCYVGEFDVFQIKAGMPVTVKIDALPGVTLKGAVKQVSKFAKTSSDANPASSAQFEVVVSLEANEKLIAGLSLTGTIETSRKAQALVVPTIAVQRDKENHFVMLDTGSGVERRDITIGMETAEKTEVLSGLNEGDTVVLQ